MFDAVLEDWSAGVLGASSAFYIRCGIAEGHLLPLLPTNTPTYRPTRLPTPAPPARPACSSWGQAQTVEAFLRQPARPRMGMPSKPIVGTAVSIQAIGRGAGRHALPACLPLPAWRSPVAICAKPVPPPGCLAAAGP